MARIKLIFMMLMLISMHATSYAQKSPPSVDGKWFGRLKIGATNLRIGMQISREGEGYRVDFYSLDQTPVSIPMEKVQYADNILSFTLSSPIAIVPEVQP